MGLLAVGCASAEPGPEAACGGAGAEVALATADGEVLTADWWPAPAQGAPAVVLVHMIPPTWDRSSWPGRARRALADEGWAVLTIDRRGAGGSTGDPEAAYEGDGGRRDLDAAVRFLVDATCGVDSERLALVGASNGTTSVNDYAASHDATLPDAAANVFLSPGAYTENQNLVAANLGLGGALLWMYPTDEPWSEGFRDAAPDGWRFVQRGLEHGTQMLDGGELEDATLADLTAFLADVFGR